MIEKRSGGARARLLTMLLLAGLSGPALAQWGGSAGLGLVVAAGNAQSQSVNGTANLARQVGQWKHHLSADVHRAKEGGIESADRLQLGYKADMTLTERLYGWGSMRYESDRFADIDRRLAGLAGVGLHTLRGPAHWLDLEAGRGYRRTTFASAMPDSHEAVGTLAANYEYRFNPTTSLTERLSVEAGQDNTLLAAITGLKVKMSDRLSLSLTYAVRRNSDFRGALGDKSDMLTTLNVVYGF
ncbi:MAG: DUF481 domain-containing protein [Burkholderiaceae bacterium]